VSLWSGRQPRRWQVEAFDAYLAAQASGGLSGGVFAACTGSGKSIHLAEVVVDLLTRVQSPGVIVVTTPTVALVEQLSATLSARLGEPVGVYYTRGKDTSQRVVVTCHPSFGDCLAALAKAGRVVAWWCADECHRTDSPQILQPAATIAEVPRIGWSATPYKSDPDPAKGLTLWLHELHRYAADDAIADGALVPWQASGLSRYDANRVNELATVADQLKPGDPRRDEIAAEQQEIVDKASVLWVQQQSGPGVVSARGVVDAEAFAKRLEDTGVRALTVHSNQSPDIRRARLAALQRGELDCVVHVQILVEGVDLPWLQWGCLRRPRGRVGFVQEVGRFLRSSPGKSQAELFDPYGLFVQHGISHVSQLAGALVEEVEEVEEDVEAVDTIELVDPLTGKVYRVPRLSKARTPVQTIAVAHAVSTSYVSECVSVLRAQGLIEVAQHERGHWRMQPASAPQLVRLESANKRMKMLKRRPEQVAKAIAYAYDLLLEEHLVTFRSRQQTTVLKGVLSDFISLDTALKPKFVGDGQFDLSLQDATIAALSRWALDSAAVVQAAKDAAKARAEVGDV
jgi:superfamily II DNA or RNA helicase